MGHQGPLSYLKACWNDLMVWSVPRGTYRAGYMGSGLVKI